MKVCLAGEGAQGFTHYEGLTALPGVEVVTVAGGIADDTAKFAADRGIPHWSLDLSECVSQPGVEAVVLTTPNALHAAQAELCLSAGKHVLVEIPMAMNLQDAERLAKLEKETGLVCMVCHSQRYNRSFQEVKRRIETGTLTLHHIVQQTYFFRRKNENRFGTPRTWTDDLLWHQLCHAIDMCFWLLDDPELEGFGQAGPDHPILGCPMDITVGLRSPNTGVVCSLAASFNNHGGIVSEYRFIGEEATISGSGGALTDHEGAVVHAPAEVDVSAGEDAEFLRAIKTKTAGLTSVSACLPVMKIIDQVHRSIDSRRPLTSRM